MTDTLRDLLRESVADADMPDLADVAWRVGARARRRRTTSVVAGAAAASLVVAGAVWAADRHHAGSGATPVQRPSPSPSTTVSPYRTGDDAPDATYRGTPVWWSPSVGQEVSLPAYPDDPYPATIDISQAGREMRVPPTRMPRVSAAFAVVGDGQSRVLSVAVVGEDGVTRYVDTARVQPTTDPEGNLRVDASASMLSPTGEYLMFPQAHSILIYQLTEARWSRISTGTDPTSDVSWVSGEDLVLSDPSSSTEQGPVYTVEGQRLAGTTPLHAVGIPRGTSQPYGRGVTGASGVAEAFGAGAPIPQPPALHLDPGQSDWIGVSGPGSILLMPQEMARQKQCCQVATWLTHDTLMYESRSADGIRLLAWKVGTGRFWQVSRVVGDRPGQDAVVASYARRWPLFG
jgi:hypothetical protein